MKTLERYEEICMNYFNGNISDFKQDLRRLTKKEILALSYQLAVRLPGHDDQAKANTIIFNYL